MAAVSSHHVAMEEAGGRGERLPLRAAWLGGKRWGAVGCACPPRRLETLALVVQSWWSNARRL